MTRLTWNAAGSRYYETGIDRGVLYIGSQPGVAWSGLTGVDESPSGGEQKSFYLDGVKYLNVSSAEEYEATITAYTYPVEFGVCDGTARPRAGLFLGQQKRKSFNLCYRTKIGNDIDGVDHAYKIHIVYNALAAPSDHSNTTINGSVDVSDFSWKITTKPVSIPGYKPTAHILLDTRYLDPVTVRNLENILYGTETAPARIPTFAELITQLDEPTRLIVTDHGNGTFDLVAPSDVLLVDNTSGLFQVTWPTANYNGDDTYTISGN